MMEHGVLKLYFARGSSSLATRIVLLECAQAFEPIEVNEHTKVMADGSDYHNINPLGYVPALQLAEGAIVLSRAHNDPIKINQAVARFAQLLQWLPRRKSGRVLQAAKKR